MGLPKRIEKFVSIFLVLMICVFGIQLVRHQQYAFFAWEEKGEIPVENQVGRHVFNLDNELLGATIFDLNRVNLENLSANSKKTRVQRGTLDSLPLVFCMEQLHAVQRTVTSYRSFRLPEVHRFILSYIYHQNGEKHSDSPYFPA